MTNPSALYLPGTTGNYVSTPYFAGIPRGDLSCIVDCRMPNWSTATTTCWMSVGTSATIRHWIFRLNSSVPSLYIDADESTLMTTASASTGLSLTNGVRGSVGFTLDINNGSTAIVKFWENSGSSWTQVGTDVDAGSTITQFTQDPALEVGSYLSTNNNFLGTIYSAQLYSGIGANTAPGQGTLVAEFRADAPVEPRYRDSTGKIWTINGSAYSWVEVA